MVILPIASFALNGWMMGWATAPSNPEWAHRYPKRAALMAAAGPAANLLLVLISGLAIRAGMMAGVFEAPNIANFTTVTAGIGPTWPAAAAPLSILFFLHLVLFAFYLLPLPPLPRRAILPRFLSDDPAAPLPPFLPHTL